MRFSRFMPVIGVVLFLGAASHASVTPPPAKVLTKKLEFAELSDTLAYPARVLSKVNTTILAETDGVIASIPAPLGTAVKRGQKILVIQHTDPVYRYAPFTVVSPVQGVVSAIEVTQGSLVTRGQKLGSVTDPAKVLVKLEIPAADLGLFRAGVEGEFRMGRENAEAIRVILAGLSPLVDPATGTASADLEILKGNQTLLPPPGTLGQVRFRVNVRKGYSIPETALFYRGEATYVRLLVEGAVKLVEVRLGRGERGQVEILPAKSDQVFPVNPILIERTSRFIADGEKVEIQQDGA
jgi:multidrug efflux pump subunit AcrA (membrane-fusion protein)